MTTAASEKKHLCILGFFKKNAVMSIALAAAIITSFIVPVDRAYIGYFDFKTLTCLFCVLAVVCAFRNINFFYVLARKVVSVFKNARLSVIALVYITFIGSMFIANDMALLTFLPLGYFVLTATNKTEYMSFTFVMQNIAANLGGMLTPFGNPQNLYLYTKFGIPTNEFMQIMFSPFLLSIILITACCIIDTLYTVSVRAFIIFRRHIRALFDLQISLKIIFNTNHYEGLYL